MTANTPRSAWMLLALSICCEVAASLSLKASLAQPGWYAVVVTGYLAAFTCLSAVLQRGMPLGVAYGIWGALGVALTAALSAVFFREALTPTMLAGMALIIAGVLTVELGSQKAHASAEASA